MNKLCKIEEEGKIFGVCAGLAKYFKIDVTIIRLLWLLLAIFGIGSPVVVYIIMAFVLPKYDPDAVEFQEVIEVHEKPEESIDPYNTDDRY